ncbi:MFS transporter, partial [Acidithiobacillus sp.]|uniref:MFS transporter n=1 Tax=Acidithiobacillus sp. TaxID=1872118 RepID=UPI002615824A
FAWDMRSYYTGSFLSLLNPFAVLCGLLSLMLSIHMGAAMLMGRAGGAVARRARDASSGALLLALLLFTAGGVWVSLMHGYVLDAGPAPAAAQNPLQQTVSLHAGAWLGNFRAHAQLWLVPLLGYAGMLLALASGALADIFDRRTLLLTAQIIMACVSALLAIVAWQGWLTPALLLTFTFLIGAGQALYNPPWQASMGDLVPRSDLP